MENGCDKCKFWLFQRNVGEGNSIGTCKRFPPKEPSRTIGISETTRTHVYTFGCDWCGEFKEK